jgi:hypothetical protein
MSNSDLHTKDDSSSSSSDDAVPQRFRFDESKAQPTPTPTPSPELTPTYHALPYAVRISQYILHPEREAEFGIEEMWKEMRKRVFEKVERHQDLKRITQWMDRYKIQGENEGWGRTEETV